MTAYFNRFSLRMIRADALGASHAGPCDADVAVILRKPAMRRQLDAISDADLAAELKEYGAWDAEELTDRAANEARLVWIAAGNIREEVMNAKDLQPGTRVTLSFGAYYPTEGATVTETVNGVFGPYALIRCDGDGRTDSIHGAETVNGIGWKREVTP